MIGGFLYHYPFWKLIEGYWQRKKLIEFAEGVHMAVVSADIGKGKTLLLSILARQLSHGIKKVGFVSNVPDAQLLSYNDINFNEPVNKKDNYRIPKYFFLDETNFWVVGVEFQKNRLYHRGVASLLQIARHHQIHLWISATRDNHVWVAVRKMMNYYIKLGGLKHLMDIGKFSFHTLRVQFYSQSWELEKEFNITVSNLDFVLYDSYWLKDTSYFRQTIDEAKYFKPKWEELSPAEKEWEEEAEKKFRGLQEKNPQIFLQVSKNYNFGKELGNFYNNLPPPQNYSEVPPSSLESKKTRKPSSKPLKTSENLAEERTEISKNNSWIPEKAEETPIPKVAKKPKFTKKKPGPKGSIIPLEDFLKD